MVSGRALPKHEANMTPAPPVPARKPIPPPPTASPKANGAAHQKKSFSVSSGTDAQAQSVVIYGAGGVGKSSACAAMKQAGFNPLAIDVGNSTRFLDMKRVGAESLQTWEDIRDCLHDETLLSGYDAIILDDLTKVEELAAKWVVQNVPHQEKESKPIKSIEDYGWGKGYSHIYDAMLLLLQDLDAQIRKGRWVVCVAHECTNTVPNPSGEDWIRYEPRLQSPASGKASVRLRVKEWCDHLLFIGYDVMVTDGRGKGSGTRTIYPNETPICMAKSRSLSDQIVYERGSCELWNLLKGTKS